MSEQIKPVAWHDMSTAPKDGTEIILENANYCRVLAHWMPGGHCIGDHPPIDAGWYFFVGNQFAVFKEPKRWMLAVQSDAVKELRNQVQQLQRENVEIKQENGTLHMLCEDRFNEIAELRAELAAAKQAHADDHGVWIEKKNALKSQLEAAKQQLAEAATFVEQFELDEYDAGCLNDYGGGNVGWWQDYVRYELNRAYECYKEQVDSLIYAARTAQAGEKQNGN